jgi:hypothetical protein
MPGMALITAIFGVAEATLSLLQEREKNYAIKKSVELAERLHHIKTEWYKEYNRDPETRSDAVLDSLELELRLVLTDFAAIIRSSDVQNK